MLSRPYLPSRLMWLELGIVAVAASLHIALVTSPTTPQTLQSLLKGVQTDLHISWWLYEGTVIEGVDVILDYTYSQRLGLLLPILFPETVVVCMSFECGSLPTPWEYSEAVAAVIRKLNLTNVFLGQCSDHFYRDISRELTDTHSILFPNIVTLEANFTQEYILNIVGKVIKPRGTNLGLFLVDSATAARLISALRTYNMWRSGFAYIFLDPPIWHLPSLLSEGALYVSDRTAAGTQTWEEAQQRLLQAQLEALSQAVGSGVETYTALLAFFASQYRGKSRQTSLVLSNILSNETFSQSISLFQSSVLRFPGNSSDLPASRQAYIPVSINSDGHSYDGSETPYMQVIMRGFYVAYEEVNNRHDLLPYFQVQTKEVALGAAYYNENWAMTQAQAYGFEGLELAYHGPSLSQNTLGVYRVFHTLNYSIPIVTAAGSYQLSDPYAYPLYLRTNNDDLFTALATARFFHLFGWTHTAIVYSNALEDTDFYECFLNATRSYHIEITNSLANRILPVALDQNETQVHATLREIIASPTRILVIAHVFSYLLVEKMYDLGARKGDFLIVLAYALSQTYYEGNDDNSRKRREIVQGAINIFPPLYVGEVGRAVMARLRAVDGNSFFTEGCLYYDNAMLVAHALDYMVQRGLHYEDGLALVKTMRDTRFVGCAGRIQIEAGRNDLIPSDQAILNLQYYPGNHSVAIKQVAIYSPFTARLFNFTANIQWPDGGDNYSDTIPMDSQCPYYLRDISESKQGKIVGLCVCFAFVGLESLVTALIWRRWWTAPEPLLTLSAPISVEDVLSLLTIALDLLEIASQGPSIVPFPVGPDTNGTFWLVTNVIFGYSWAYLVLFILMLLDFHGKLYSRGICVFYIYWLELLLPSLNNLLFLPVISVLLSHFACFRAVSSGSLLNRDCSETCWTGKHLPYSLTAAITLLLYVPIAVLSRPLWQVLQPSLHLKAQPRFLMVKSVFQIGLVAATITLDVKEQALVYLLLLTGYLPLVVTIKAYNYHR